MNNSSKLNILQWNCRSLNSKISDLCNLLNFKNIDVVCLSETWRGPDEASKIPSFNLFEFTNNLPADNGVFYGGVAIAVRSIIRFEKIRLNFDCHPFQ